MVTLKKIDGITKVSPNDVIPIIEVMNIAYAIDGKSILKDICFTIGNGDYLTIIGPNGAGKTTLLKCINRIIRFQKGDIKIAGVSIAQYSQRDIAKEISYVPQFESGSCPFSVYDFVMMSCYPHLSPFSSVSADYKELVNESLIICGVSDLKNRILDTLSGGERQRVFVAAAIAQDAEIILLDEPTSFLDPLHAKEVNDLLVKLNREHCKTVVAVTHDINNAVIMGNRVLAIKNGEIVFEGTTDKLMNNSVLSVIYDKEFIFVDHPVSGSNMIVPDLPI